MRIGIDFDNTLIDYDRVFVAAAKTRALVPADFAGSKKAVRDAIRLLPDGEIAWQRLQGYVYGAGIGGAALFDGAREFLARCARERIDTFIVSHKTQYGHYDPARVDLREAARGWMTAQGVFAAGLAADNVFFAADRAQKLARVAALGCTHFIDDLEEVFADPAFPNGVQRILFGAAPSDPAVCDRVCADWREVAAVVFGETTDRGRGAAPA